LYNCIKVIKFPPQSPDLNVNENLWAKFETAIRKHATSNKEDLKKAVR
jgi:transposase